MPLNAKWFSTRQEFLLPSDADGIVGVAAAARDPIITGVHSMQWPPFQRLDDFLSLSPFLPSRLMCQIVRRFIFFIIRQHTSKLPELATRSVPRSVPATDSVAMQLNNLQLPFDRVDGNKIAQRFAERIAGNRGTTDGGGGDDRTGCASACRSFVHIEELCSRRHFRT